jgi:hypothetical protein
MGIQENEMITREQLKKKRKKQVITYSRKKTNYEK